MLQASYSFLHLSGDASNLNVKVVVLVTTLYKIAKPLNLRNVFHLTCHVSHYRILTICMMRTMRQLVHLYLHRYSMKHSMEGFIVLLELYFSYVLSGDPFSFVDCQLLHLLLES